jgi:hypothetical protein
LSVFTFNAPAAWFNPGPAPVPYPAAFTMNGRVKVPFTQTWAGQNEGFRSGSGGSSVIATLLPFPRMTATLEFTMLTPAEWTLLNDLFNQVGWPGHPFYLTIDRTNDGRVPILGVEDYVCRWLNAEQSPSLARTEPGGQGRYNVTFGIQTAPEFQHILVANQ